MRGEKGGRDLKSIISMLDKNVLRAKTLHDIARNITFSSNLDAIYKTALDSSVEVLNASGGSFLVYNSEESGFDVMYKCGEPLKEEFFAYNEVFPEGLESISIDNSLIFQMLNKNSALKKLMRSLKASVIIPIVIKEALYGILVLGNKTDGAPYSSGDIEYLVTLCSLISVSIENLESQKELNYNIFELTTLYEISKELSSTLDITQIQTAIIFCCMGVVGAKRGAIFLFDADNNSINMTQTVNFPSDVERNLSFKMDETLKNRLSSMSAPFFISDLRKNSKEYNLFKRINEALRVIKNPLIIPQIIKDKLVGYLILAEKITQNSYSKTDINLLSSLSYQSSLAIINAQAYLEAENLAKKNASLYEELKVATAEKLKAERLATLGMVVSNIIHDIKNPLTSIRYFSALMGGVEADKPKKKVFVEIIESETKRLVGMIEDILTFAKGDESKLKKEKCCIKDLLEEVCVVLEVDFKDKNISVLREIKCTGDVYLDVDKIKRVLYNISFNARDALKKRGGTIKLKAHKTKGALNISIADDGKGIPKSIIETVFMPFISWGKKGGTGLGLAISKKIVEDHGGTLTFSSRKGKGTTFIIKLPITAK